MNFRFVRPDLRLIDQIDAEAIVCSIWEDLRPFQGLAGLVDWRLAGMLSSRARRGDLVGSRGEATLVPGHPKLPFDKVIVFGMGARRAFEESVFEETLLHAFQCLEGLQIRRVALELPGRYDKAFDPNRVATILLAATSGTRTIDTATLVETEDGEIQFNRRLRDEEARRRRL